MASGVDDGHGHRPVVSVRFGKRRRRDFLRRRRGDDGPYSFDMFTAFLRKSSHFERCEQRHRAAAIVGAFDRGAIEVVPRGRARAGAAADVDQPAVFDDVRRERAPGARDDGRVRALEPSEAYATSHRRQDHRRRGLLPIGPGPIDDFSPHAVGRLVFAHGLHLAPEDLEDARPGGVRLGHGGQRFHQAERREAVAAAPRGGAVGRVIEDAIRPLQARGIFDELLRRQVVASCARQHRCRHEHVVGPPAPVRVRAVRLPRRRQVGAFDQQRTRLRVPVERGELPEDHVAGNRRQRRLIAKRRLFTRGARRASARGLSRATRLHR